MDKNIITKKNNINNNNNLNNSYYSKDNCVNDYII